MLNSKLNVWQTVKQSRLCHPDWTAEDHVGYLDAEWWQTADWRTSLNPEMVGQDSPEALVAWWLTPAAGPASVIDAQERFEMAQAAR